MKLAIKPLVLSTVATVGLGILAPNAQAAIIFDQSLTSNPVVVRASIFGVQINADNFVPTQTGSVNTIQFWGEFNGTGGTAPDNFTVQFFNDVSGSPATSAFATFANVAASRTATSFTPFLGESAVFQFDLTLPSSVSVSAGTTYYLSITHQTLTDLNNAFNWDLRSGGGTRWLRQNANATADSTSAWTSSTATSGQFAFNLQGEPVSTPEPSSLVALLALGLAGVGLRKRI